MSTPSPYIIGRIPKLPPKYALIVMPLIMSCLMSGLISFVATLRNLGWTADLLHAWLGGWGMAWAVAFPALLLVAPIVKRVTQRLVRLQ